MRARSHPMPARRLLAGLSTLAAAATVAAQTSLAPATAAAADDDPLAQLQFIEEPAAGCVARNGLQILVRNRHPSRTLRVWLDRIHMGVGTGDRSRSDLAPGAEPEPLGCSRSLSGPQHWRPVRAVFLD